MKISTKGRYGLRALLDLAAQPDGEATTLANIAERQGISVGYLEQIFSALRKAGIVIGTKGPQGGYVLAQPAEQTTIRSILDVLEGDLFSTAEESSDIEDAALMLDVLKENVWDRMNAAAASALDGVTIRSLVESYQDKKHKGEYLYFI